MAVLFDAREGNTFGPRFTFNATAPPGVVLYISRNKRNEPAAAVTCDEDASYHIRVDNNINNQFVSIALTGTQMEELYLAYRVLRTGYEGISNGEG